MRGLKIGKSSLSNLSGISRENIEFILDGGFSEMCLIKLAPILGLDVQKLLISAKKEWVPKKREPSNLKKFESVFGSMTVNSYIVFEKTERIAWIFDTGTNCDSLVSFIKEEELKVESIFLTHAHRDHIFCLGQLRALFEQSDIYIHPAELLKNTKDFNEGDERSLGSLSLEAFHTCGHSPGGLTFLIKGLENPLAVVGDALFAGSMGGGMISYKDALRNNREKIMTLPNETVLCPGHGPMTTVGEEKKFNPFFPEF